MSEGFSLADFQSLLDETEAPQTIRAEPSTARVSSGLFDELLHDVPLSRKPGRPPLEGVAMTKQQRNAKYKFKKRQEKFSQIAILDFETDPFDNVTRETIYPFLCVLYGEGFETITIWDDDHESFIEKVYSAIEQLDGQYTIYAHNGGKFDFMFFLHKLRGKIKFKGRGIMSCRIGMHELRDSFHIIPEALATYKKDDFDYSKLARRNRQALRDEIIRYCVNDTKYLYQIVKAFVSEHGFKLSIGQAAMVKIKEHYDWERISPDTDDYLRQWFFGGRVECVRGKIDVTGDYKLYDVNSMYPFVMATRLHPIGRNYFPRVGKPDAQTVFIELTCDSRGAFVRRNPETKETHAPHGRYRFFTTIWEYEVAKRYGLISNEEIHCCVDNALRTNFSKFVLPLYENRLHTKDRLAKMKELGLDNTPEFFDVKKDDIFYKLLLNNGYGKFAQNPRNYKEHFITDPGDILDPDEWGEHPAVMSADYWIWEKPNPSFRFNNVGTGASITGAARAVLLEALVTAVDPIYCDTDSIICKELRGQPIHKTALGAWDIEKELSRVIINGKKLYTYEEKSGKRSVKSKGAGAGTLTWDHMEAINLGEIITSVAKGVTLTKAGEQFYMSRRIRATASDPSHAGIWNCSPASQSAIAGLA